MKKYCKKCRRRISPRKSVCSGCGMATSQTSDGTTDRASTSTSNSSQSGSAPSLSDYSASWVSRLVAFIDDRYMYPHLLAFLIATIQFLLSDDLALWTNGRLTDGWIESVRILEAKGRDDVSTTNVDIAFRTPEGIIHSPSHIMFRGAFVRVNDVVQIRYVPSSPQICETSSGTARDIAWDACLWLLIIFSWWMASSVWVGLFYWYMELEPIDRILFVLVTAGFIVFIVYGIWIRPVEYRFVFVVLLVLSSALMLFVSARRRR